MSRSRGRGVRTACGMTLALLVSACGLGEQPVSPSQRAIAPERSRFSSLTEPLEILNGARLTLHGAEKGILALEAESVSVEPRNLGPFRIADINQLRIADMELTAVLSTGPENPQTHGSRRDQFRSSLENLYRKVPDHFGKITRLVAEQPTLKIYPDIDKSYYTRVEAEVLVYDLHKNSDARLYNVRFSDSRRDEQLLVAEASWDLETMQFTPR